MKLTRWSSLYVLSAGGFAALAAGGSAGVTAMGGCSNNNGGEVDAGSSSSSGGGSSSGMSSSGGGTCSSPPSGCTTPMHQTMAAKLTMVSTWPSTTAIAGCDPTNCTGTMSQVLLLLLIDYDIDPSTMKLKGTSRTCQNQTPPITLSDFGAQASGVAKGSQVQVVIAQDAWDKQPTTPVTGSVANGTFVLDSSVTLNGLAANAPYSDPTMAWPPTSPKPMSDPPIDMKYWDNSDMNPSMGGITAAFKADMSPFIIPKVALSPTAPQTDQIYVALRTEIALSGCMSSCTDGSGNASVPLLQNHVIGCHVPAGDAGAARACTPAEYNFIDQNSTAYMVTSGTFVSKVVTGSGGAATCADVRAALP